MTHAATNYAEDNPNVFDGVGVGKGTRNIWDQKYILLKSVENTLNTFLFL